MYQNEIEAYREKMLKEIRESQCAQLRPTASTQCHTTNYNRVAYQPSPAPLSASYQEPAKRLSDEEIYYRSVSEQNQKLLQEKQKLITTIQLLQSEVRRLREENTTFVAKENKGKVFKDMLADAKKFTENLYDKTIEWLKT